MSTPRYKVDPNSDTWRAIDDWIETRLAFRRANLETVGMPPDDTENCRGAIEELKELRESVKHPRAVGAAGVPGAVDLVPGGGY